MKHYKTVTIPEYTKKVEDRVTCDLCGDDIVEKHHEVNEVTVSYRYGESYPEEGWGQEVKVDMCGKCFKLKLMPWLSSQGVQLIEREWEW
jgi:hypothetical protein